MGSPLSPWPKSRVIKALSRQLVRAALQAVDPGLLLREKLTVRPRELLVCGELFSLRGVEKIHLLAAGKGALPFWRGAAHVLKNRIHGGVIVAPADSPAQSDSNIEVVSGAHPLPDRRNLQAAWAFRRYANNHIGANDLVLFLVTGGASALLTEPLPPFRLRDKIAITRRLQAAGAPIRELNCLRKHMSAIKGGRLAARLHPARVLTLIVSDIIDSPPEDIGSGPTIPDPSTWPEALDILERHDLLARLGPHLRNCFSRARAGEIPETPKPGDARFAGHGHAILGDNRVALNSLCAAARRQGLRTDILTSRDSGEARQAARVYAALIKKISQTGQPWQPPLLLLAGGELTVTVSGRGQGGRNQEFMLQLLKELEELPYPFFALSLGSDGIDGPTDAAGAWIDQQTRAKAQRLDLDIDRHLRQNDSHRFFKALNQLWITGPTSANVMDIRMFFIG